MKNTEEIDENRKCISMKIKIILINEKKIENSRK